MKFHRHRVPSAGQSPRHDPFLRVETAHQSLMVLFLVKSNFAAFEIRFFQHSNGLNYKLRIQLCILIISFIVFAGQRGFTVKTSTKPLSNIIVNPSFNQVFLFLIFIFWFSHFNFRFFSFHCSKAPLSKMAPVRRKRARSRTSPYGRKRQMIADPQSVPQVWKISTSKKTRMHRVKSEG